MTNSSREYIYVRGGGKYYFVATNTGTPFLVTSDYTASNQTISVKTSVTTPAITNATKTEVSSEIKVVKGLIEQKVAKTDYDKNNQVLNQSIGNLQTSYNSISGTVSSLNTRLQIVEKAGFITTSQGNTLYASKKLENGNELISYINQDATTFAVKANKIKLEGLVTANGNVQITTEGKIIAVNAEITGKITAGSGKIGGFNIYTDYIENNRFKLSDDMILFKNGTSKVVVGVNHKSLSGTSYQPLLYLFTPSLASNESCAYMECNGNILELCKRTEVINAKGTVTINGAVMVPNTVSYMQGKDVDYYLNQAGGYSDNAKKSKKFIVYMNGQVTKVKGSGKKQIEPGCEIIVPSKAKKKANIGNILGYATTFSTLGMMVASIANLIKK